MTTFYLIRHGAKEKVMGNPPLSPLGRKQAAVTAQFLKEFPITALFASPLLRTKETAEIIGKALGIAVKTDERLKERMNWGDKKGESFENFLAEWEKATENRQYQPIHGDSAFATGKRLESFFREKAKEQNSGHIAVVSHGGAIGDFLENQFTDLPVISSPQGFSYVHIFECSLTTIVLENSMFILKNVGSTAHLPEPLL